MLSPTPFHLEFPPREDTETAETEGAETGVLTVPEIDEPGTSGSDYRVILYNDEWHSVDEVMVQLIKATQCSPEKAYQITLEVDAKGRGVCYRGNREKCQHVVKVLREIRLQCEVDCD